LYLQIFHTENYILFKISASGPAGPLVDAETILNISIISAMSYSQRTHSYKKEKCVSVKHFGKRSVKVIIKSFMEGVRLGERSDKV